MCGRFTQTATPETIAELFHLDEPPLFQARYNISPSQSIATIRINPDIAKRECVMLQWGLIPSWAKDPRIGAQCINAKAETVAEKPAFRSAFKKRRCLVLADGFYEWQQQGKRKQPIWIGLKSKRLFAFAGLWEHWQPPTGDPLETCSPELAANTTVLPLARMRFSMERTIGRTPFAMTDRPPASASPLGSPDTAMTERLSLVSDADVPLPAIPLAETHDPLDDMIGVAPPPCLSHHPTTLPMTSRTRTGAPGSAPGSSDMSRPTTPITPDPLPGLTNNERNGHPLPPS